MKSTAGELLTYRRGLGELPGAQKDGEGWRVRQPRTAPVLEAASVFLPWGGVFNYGHFLLDALPALEALRNAGVLADAPAIAAPLRRWQRALLQRAYPEILVRAVPADWMQAERVSFSPAMNHYLHLPGPLTQAVRARLLAATPRQRGPSLKLYLSRRGLSGRILVNEAELETALVQRGFRVLHTERMTVEAQAAAMAQASVIVGASGAAFANIIQAPETCRVIEILPEGFGAPWVRNTCRLLGQDWRGWFAPAPCDAAEAPVLSRMRRGFRFAWKLDLAAFLQWAEL